ncbi:MAG: HEAT repeat domain-containing protein [Planctomycetota bacterium]
MTSRFHRQCTPLRGHAPSRQLALRALARVAFGAGLLCLLGGCQWVTAIPNRLWLGASPAGDALNEPAPTIDPDAGSAAELDEAAVRDVLARATQKDATGRERSIWIRSVDGENRWRYPALEDLLARPLAVRPDLRSYLPDRDPIVAANAAIGLARQGDDAGRSQLIAAVRAPAIPLAMRLAAVESIGLLAPRRAVGALRELLMQYGRMPAKGSGTYVAELHVELLRGLARHVDAADEPLIAEALSSTSAQVKIEALDAWAKSTLGQLPQAAIDLRGSGDPAIRCASLRAIAAHRLPQAEQYVLAALRDHDLSVRVMAIDCLGSLGGAEAQQTLAGLIDPAQSERVRQAAVSALRRIDEHAAVHAAIGDSSWRVRGEVADALAGMPDAAGLATAARLLDDPSAAVQGRVLRAIANWPAGQSGPLLLQAMGNPAYTTRTQAAAMLAAIWPPAAKFPAEAPASRRSEALVELQRQFCADFARERLAHVHAPEVSASPISAEELDRLATELLRDEFASLEKWGDRLPEVLEQWIQQRGQPLPQRVWREVLPKHGEIFAVLDQLDTPEVVEQRRAVALLRGAATGNALPYLAIVRLSELLVRHDDALVWQAALDTLGGDGREPAIQMAYAALGHPASEVRRRGCELLAANPSPRHVPALLPLVNDPVQPVAASAVLAVGLCGPAENSVPALRNLLGSGLALEAAVSLARLGDPSGIAAVERAAYDPDPHQQRRAAEAIGELGDPSLVPALIYMLDGHAAVQRAALRSLDQVVDAEATIGSHPGESTTEQVRRWKQWHRRATEAAATRLPARQ